MSFNSPPATERACGFDNEEDCGNYYMVDESNHPLFGNKPKRSSYINIQNFECGNDPSGSQKAQHDFTDAQCKASSSIDQRTLAIAS